MVLSQTIAMEKLFLTLILIDWAWNTVTSITLLCCGLQKGIILWIWPESTCEMYHLSACILKKNLFITAFSMIVICKRHQEFLVEPSLSVRSGDLCSSSMNFLNLYWGSDNLCYPTTKIPFGIHFAWWWVLNNRWH